MAVLFDYFNSYSRQNNNKSLFFHHISIYTTFTKKQLRGKLGKISKHYVLNTFIVGSRTSL